MCSIIGFLGLGGTQANNDVEERMNLALRLMARRGPDQQAMVRVSRECILGGNRLIVRGDRKVGKMPFKNGNTIAFYNGEIYNAHNWTSSASDGDAILPAYAKYGVRFPSEFDGEFAICLWDDHAGRLLLARDVFGTKPLFFAFDRTKLIWASSEAALATMADSFELCRAVRGPAYQHTYAIQEPYTSYAGIWQLPPAHYLIASRQSVEVGPYFIWGSDAQEPEMPASELEESLWSALCTRLHHRTTVAIPMSGGIDSGIIAFAAEQLGCAYHVFSVVSIFGRSTVEAPSIFERVSRLKNCSGVTLIDFSLDDYERAIASLYTDCYHASEYYDNGALLTHAVMERVAEAGIRVVVDGSGGDELFDGYDFRADLAAPDGWPRPWKTQSLYSIFTTLLAYTAKVDRAGAFFSIEPRFPFQSRSLAHAALRRVGLTKKAPLRDFLLRRLPYGEPLAPDICGKYGFSMRGCDLDRIRARMRREWCLAHGLTSPPSAPPIDFPMAVGRCVQHNWHRETWS